MVWARAQLSSANFTGPTLRRLDGKAVESQASGADPPGLFALGNKLTETAQFAFGARSAL